ncbi:MAG TPA: hypothetical protein VFQ45_09280 [Longimicrobium sp.]|nr:hypothetical protein [Longimicrobium sp.]
MPQLLRALAVLALLTAAPAAAQERPPTREEAAVNAVISHRVQWLRDDTPFHACRVFEALGRPADFPAGILPAHRRLLTRTQDPCAPPAPGAPPADVVLLDTLLVQDSTARVSLTVRAGERVHREQYRLVNPGRGSWGLESVLSWGHLRVHGVPPRDPRRDKPADDEDDCGAGQRAATPDRR